MFNRVKCQNVFNHSNITLDIQWKPSKHFKSVRCRPDIYFNIGPTSVITSARQRECNTAQCWPDIGMYIGPTSVITSARDRECNTARCWPDIGMYIGPRSGVQHGSMLARHWYVYRRYLLEPAWCRHTFNHSSVPV